MLAAIAAFLVRRHRQRIVGIYYVASRSARQVCCWCFTSVPAKFVIVESAGRCSQCAIVRVEITDTDNCAVAEIGHVDWRVSECACVGVSVICVGGRFVCENTQYWPKPVPKHATAKYYAHCTTFQNTKQNHKTGSTKSCTRQDHNCAAFAKIVTAGAAGAARAAGAAGAASVQVCNCASRVFFVSIHILFACCWRVSCKRQHGLTEKR